MRSSKSWLGVSEDQSRASISGRERELQAASGVIARKLSNELKDLAAVAETQ